MGTGKGSTRRGREAEFRRSGFRRLRGSPPPPRKTHRWGRQTSSDVFASGVRGLSLRVAAFRAARPLSRSPRSRGLTRRGRSFPTFCVWRPATDGGGDGFPKILGGEAAITMTTASGYEFEQGATRKDFKAADVPEKAVEGRANGANHRNKR